MNTREQTVKTELDLPELGINISLEVVNNAIESIIIGDGDDYIRITKATEYGQSLRVLKPQEEKTKTVYVVSGKLLGIADYESDEFDVGYKADQHLSELMNKHGDMIGVEVVEKEVKYFEDKI